MIKRSVEIKQRDISDCGATCLVSIAAHYKLKLPVAKIRQAAGTDKKGTSALGLIEASEKLGFSAKGVRCELDALPNVPLPAIAHVIIKKVLHHFIVVYKVTEKKITVMDPAIGEMVSYSKNDFNEIWSGVLIIMVPNERFKPGNEKISIGSRFWFLISPHKSILIQSIIGASIFTLIGLSTAIYVQKIIDFVLPSQNYNLLNLLGVGMLFLIAIQVIINILKSIFILKTGQQIDAKLILGYYKHLLTLPQQFFDNMRVGEIISRINDAVKIRSFINETAIDILINVFVLVFSFVLMFTYYWKLALIIAIVIPLYALIFSITNMLNKKVERKVMENAAELESHLVESIGSIKTIKSFGMEFYSGVKTETRFVNLLNSVYKSGLNSIFTSNSSLIVSRLFTVIILWSGAGFVMDQVISPGELMSFYAIIGFFTGPVGGLIGANRTFQNAKIAADRLFEIMDLDAEIEDNFIEIDHSDIGNIKFENVSFRYGTRKTVFEDLTLTIKKGDITAIVGESGCGKSTIASLLKNLYPIEGGSIHIGAYNIKSLSRDSINSIVGIVPQEVSLFAGSVIENIAVGEFQPDTKRIMHLAGQIDMLDFINELPAGLGTYLGENGLNLSGGQRQKLAILRALYPDPPIMIFDEATSALDSNAEDAIIRTILNLKDDGKTCITISHRMSSVTMADKIIVLEKGKVLNEGTHIQLMQECATYRAFCERQMGKNLLINT
jgi:ATP-binding cassette, subfamily C, bacteriocin exporter